MYVARWQVSTTANGMRAARNSRDMPPDLRMWMSWLHGQTHILGSNRADIPVPRVRGSAPLHWYTGGLTHKMTRGIIF
jgi:hypothetical protein